MEKDQLIKSVFRNILRSFGLQKTTPSLSSCHLTCKPVPALAYGAAARFTSCLSRKRMLYLLTSIALAIYMAQCCKIKMPELINNYVNDFICMPIVLGYMTLLFRFLRMEPDFRFSIFFKYLLAVYYALYFEWYLPRVDIRYTADIYDALLYCTGGILYHLCERPIHGPRVEKYDNDF